MCKKYLEEIVKTELGIMSRKKYLDRCVSAKALFWEVKKDGTKTIKYFAGIGKISIKLNKTMFDYAMSKVDYKMDFRVDYAS